MASTLLRRLKTFFTSGLLITAVSVTTTGGAAWTPPTITPRTPPHYVQGKVPQSSKTATGEGRLVQTAVSSIGTPYSPLGGTPERGFSTPGFTRWVFQEAGVTLPLSAEGQWFMGAPVPQTEAGPGTLVYSTNQVGVVVAPDLVVWASEDAGEVVASSLDRFSAEPLRFAQVDLPTA